MRLTGWIIVAVLAVLAIGGGHILWRDHIREPAIAAGPLSDALVAARDPQERNQIFDEVFARFVPPDAPLEERIPVLLANGFACDLSESDLVAGNHILFCARPVPDTAFCEGFTYYAYEAADGRIVETQGVGYETGNGRKNLFGICGDNRRRYLDLMQRIPA